MRRLFALLALGLAALLAGCGYNEIQAKDEAVKAAWAEVLSQYQRRADLIPNIVNTVKGEANFEQETLVRVIEARAKATSIQATPELINDPAALACSPSSRTTRTSRRTRHSRTCAPSSKAPKTASRSPATATSRPRRSTTCWCGSSPSI
jgi:hypothetical protein